MSATTSSIPTSSVGIKPKYTEEEIKNLNSIKSKSTPFKIVNIVALSGMLVSTLGMIIFTFILSSVTRKPYTNILLNNIYRIIIIILCSGGLGLGIYNIVKYNKDNDILIDLYKKITNGTDISYDNIKASLKEKSDGDVRDYIIDKNYYGIFDDMLDMSEIKLNYSVGVANTIIGAISLPLIIIAIMIFVIKF
jgi:hypothetical protein